MQLGFEPGTGGDQNQGFWKLNEILHMIHAHKTFSLFFSFSQFNVIRINYLL